MLKWNNALFCKATYITYIAITNWSVFFNTLFIFCVFLFPVDIEEEKNLVVQALRLNTLSKLTFSDCKRFDALIQDVFPGINFKDVEYTTLREALRDAMKELGLVESKVQVSCNENNFFEIIRPISSALQCILIKKKKLFRLVWENVKFWYLKTDSQYFNQTPQRFYPVNFKFQKQTLGNLFFFHFV